MAQVVFNTGKFAEKVTAMAMYDSNVITQLYENPVNKQKIVKGAAFLIKNYFDEYIDSKARQDSSKYHHVYEFDQIGKKNARLFKGSVSSEMESAIISYKFTMSKTPNKFGYLFSNKAQVMEDNNPIIVKPKKEKYLKYALSDGSFVTTSQSVIEHPGGEEVKNSFQNTFYNFIETQAELILGKFGFYEKLEAMLVEKRRVAISRINSGATNIGVTQAFTDAQVISEGVNAKYV